jgi:hypothetical protein
MYPKIHKLSHIRDSNLGVSQYPRYNSMDLTPNEYREFLSQFGITLNYLKKYFNDVIFRQGILTPYDYKEFYSYVEFLPGSMNIMMKIGEHEVH